MAWLRRTLAVDVAGAPADVARRLERHGRGDGPLRLFGPIGPAGFDLHTAWRPSILRQRYPVNVFGTLTPTSGGSRVEATVGVGFAVQFMLAGAVAVAGLAVRAGFAGSWSPGTAGLVVGIALGHAYSVFANVRDVERTLLRALSGPPPADAPPAS